MRVGRADGGWSSHFCARRRARSVHLLDRSFTVHWRHAIDAASALISADYVFGLVHLHQLIVIDFLQAENRLLKERLRGRRIRFTDAERALLARKAKAVGRRALLKLDTIVSPDTLLRWHRKLVAQKWNFAARRGLGRPGIMREISKLIIGMGLENPSWGYTRIQGALANVGHKVGRGTIANVLKRNGVEPSPVRNKRTRWSTFLKAHWKVIAASDFFTVEVWTGRGLVTHYLLFVIRLAERAVQVVGITQFQTKHGFSRLDAA